MDNLNFLRECTQGRKYWLTSSVEESNVEDKQGCTDPPVKGSVAVLWSLKVIDGWALEPCGTLNGNSIQARYYFKNQRWYIGSFIAKNYYIFVRELCYTLQYTFHKIYINTNNLFVKINARSFYADQKRVCISNMWHDI